MKLTRVLLADDHTLVRSGIRALLSQLPGVEVVAEANDGRQALQLAQSHNPDVAVLDVAMPNLNGIETAIQLHQQFPGLKIIILSMHANDEYVLQAFKAGASAYLLKRSAVKELRAAFKALSAGDLFLSQELAQRVSMEQIRAAQEPPKEPEKLTPRQREILQLIAESKTTKEIALILDLSPKTIEFHRAEIMNRLAIYDVASLVRYALHTGLTFPES